MIDLFMTTEQAGGICLTSLQVPIWSMTHVNTQADNAFPGDSTALIEVARGSVYLAIELASS